ncbi:MAG: hypothetical protein FJ037_04100 [Chloroflexi bacterium]|nr:hypothetical protein [Chloroflexota bacterium]
MSEAPTVRPRRIVSPLLILALGLLLGRMASQLPEWPRGLVDLLIAVLVAVSVTTMWRRWARRAMEQRRLEQQQRRERARGSKQP